MTGDAIAVPAPSAIVWDWDNTLVDGWPAVTAGLNVAFAAFGLPQWTVERTRAEVRRSLRDSFPEIFGPDWERARDLFYAEVRARHLAVLRPMPEVGLALRAASRWPQAVVSNKQGPILRAEAEHLGWTGYFRTLVGAGDAAADKPDPAPFRMALTACNIEPGPAVWYVGDTGIDVQGARAAGCTAILLGDAAHDGGVANVAPDAAFADAAALARQLDTYR